MKVFGLVGPSGTGKSHRAMTVAYENNIDAVIDDGLLIRDGKRMAGISAKAEPSAIKAVKRAIFTDPKHRQQVIKQLEYVRPARLLILGTSEKMVALIARALNLPAPEKFFYIEDLASPEEIAMARQLRQTYGMHVIPVPVMEVKEDLPGYLMRPIRYLIGITSANKAKHGEKTIMQPRFSSMGRLIITQQAMEQLCRGIVSQVRAVEQISRMTTEVSRGNVSVSLEFTALLPRPVQETAAEVSGRLNRQIVQFCGMNVENIQVLVRDVKMAPPPDCRRSSPGEEEETLLMPGQP